MIHANSYVIRAISFPLWDVADFEQLKNTSLYLLIRCIVESMSGQNLFLFFIKNDCM